MEESKNEVISLQGNSDKIVALNITKAIRLNQLTDKDYLEWYTRSAWRAGGNLIMANVLLAYRIIPSWIKGIPGKRLVVAVFGIDPEEGCKQSAVIGKNGKKYRKVIMLVPADRDVERKYIGKYLPQFKPGDRNPVRYLGAWPDKEADGFTKKK